MKRLHEMLGSDFPALFAGIKTPDNPDSLATIPAPIPPERDPGVIDLNPETVGDPDVVARIDAWRRKRDRNSPRPHGIDPEPPEAA